MELSKKYIHDKLMLLLASSNIFLAFLCGVFILLRTSGEGGADGFIVEYRSNLGIGAFQTGGAIDMLSFAVFAMVVAALAIMLSINTYRIRRALSVIILCAGILLLSMSIIVSITLTGLQ